MLAEAQVAVERLHAQRSAPCDLSRALVELLKAPFPH